VPGALPLAAAAVLALGGAAPLPSYRPGVVLLRFADPQLSEVSGVAASPYDVGVLFVHNDSGGRARFAAVGTDGTTRAWYRLAGATNVDWEDVAAAPDSQGRPSLWFGDIGDNDRRRAAVVVYRVAAPRLPADPVRATAVAVPWQAYRLVYPDGPHDAEALLVDARTGTLGIVAKTLGPASLYTASLPLRAGTTRLVQAGAVAAGRW